jgi:hypothetical protein
VPAEHAPAHEPGGVVGVVAYHEHRAARAEAVEPLDGLAHDWLVVTEEGDEEPEELEELEELLDEPELELPLDVVDALELVVVDAAASRSFSRLSSAARLAAAARRLAAAATSLDDDDEDVLVPVVRAAATCLVVVLFADSAGSLPSTICTKIPSHAAMNTATVTATTVRLIRRALLRRARIRARPSALPES